MTAFMNGACVVSPHNGQSARHSSFASKTTATFGSLLKDVARPAVNVTEKSRAPQAWHFV